MTHHSQFLSAFINIVDHFDFNKAEHKIQVSNRKRSHSSHLLLNNYSFCLSLCEYWWKSRTFRTMLDPWMSRRFGSIASWLSFLIKFVLNLRVYSIIQMCWLDFIWIGWSWKAERFTSEPSHGPKFVLESSISNRLHIFYCIASLRSLVQVISATECNFSLLFHLNFQKIYYLLLISE